MEQDLPRTDPNVLLEHLVALYGTNRGRAAHERLLVILRDQARVLPPPGKERARPLSAGDAVLITYGDQVQSPESPPLRTLADFCTRHLPNLVSGIHLLPFYPYSSDDGFSVIDYRAVDRALGNWGDIARLGERFRLMFDAVINHVSAESAWFAGFLQDDPRYREFFIVVPDGVDLSRVVRPRTLPLLTRVRTPSGEKNVWTTFSADQIDLNYRHPEVLLEIVDTLLFYVAHGAEFIRLDAVAFLWKEWGTTCLHLPQTHRVIQFLRAVLDQIAPHVMLITETNVPHAENLSYFGDGSNEAQLVYNFALPPLVLHTFHTGNAHALTAWAGALALPSHRVTFFNFLASHDGVGLNPVRGILTPAEIEALVARTLAQGGLISSKKNPDGTTGPYELNINYWDALSNPSSAESLTLQVDRFIAAQAIMLSIVGVPGIYFHSLFGSRGWSEGVARTGHNRTINRQKCDLASLERELADPESRRARVFARYSELLRVRAAHPAFDPYGTMRVVDLGPSLFAVLRTAPDQGDQVLCLHNVTGRPQTIPPHGWNTLVPPAGSLLDLFARHAINPTAPLELAPYQVLWVSSRSV